MQHVGYSQGEKHFVMSSVIFFRYFLFLFRFRVDVEILCYWKNICKQLKMDSGEISSPLSMMF